MKQSRGDAGTGRSPTAATAHVSINTLISLRCFVLGHGHFVQINGLVEILAQVITRAGKFSGQDFKKTPTPRWSAVSSMISTFDQIVKM